MQETNDKGIAGIHVTEDSYECTITVDCSVFGFQEGELKLLLIQRDIGPFKGWWHVPGGLLQEGETAEQAVSSVLFDLTGIKNVHHEQVHCYTDIDRHPVKRVVTISYYALINPENHPIISKRYGFGVGWFSLDEVPKLGFDHERLFRDALKQLRSNVEEQLTLGELLPKKFTLTELQVLYEALLDKKLDRRNFRKRILQKELIRKSGEKKTGVRGGPELFEFIKK